MYVINHFETIEKNVNDDVTIFRTTEKLCYAEIFREFMMIGNTMELWWFESN